jgi:hypothetical protein
MRTREAGYEYITDKQIRSREPPKRGGTPGGSDKYIFE